MPGAAGVGRLFISTVPVPCLQRTNNTLRWQVKRLRHFCGTAEDIVLLGWRQLSKHVHTNTHTLKHTQTRAKTTRCLCMNESSVSLLHINLLCIGSADQWCIVYTGGASRDWLSVLKYQITWCTYWSCQQIVCKMMCVRETCFVGRSGPLYVQMCWLREIGGSVPRESWLSRRRHNVKAKHI